MNSGLALPTIVVFAAAVVVPTAIARGQWALTVGFTAAGAGLVLTGLGIVGKGRQRRRASSRCHEHISLRHRCLLDFWLVWWECLFDARNGLLCMVDGFRVRHRERHEGRGLMSNQVRRVIVAETRISLVIETVVPAPVFHRFAAAEVCG